MTFKVTYGRTVNGVHIELTLVRKEGYDPAVVYNECKEFVESRFKAMRDNYEL